MSSRKALSSGFHCSLLARKGPRIQRLKKQLKEAEKISAAKPPTSLWFYRVFRGESEQKIEGKGLFQTETKIKKRLEGNSETETSLAFKVGDHNSDFRIPGTSRAFTPSPGTAPVLCESGSVFEELLRHRTSLKSSYRSRRKTAIEPDLRPYARRPIKQLMSVTQLDFIFPFVVFFYGFLAVLVLETPALARLGRERMSDAWQGIESRKNIAWICFFLGGLWSLQNLWF